MSNTKLYIPKTLNVGYQERSGTYTGKLAYVVYTDDKGVVRKETSWRGWCKHLIGEVDNTPTEGFVLNKGVGGQRESWGWNARNEYIRVYDPRGWEFEISVANLLYILQECTSTKGKGLEGKFVYSWEGKELVLLPVDTYEYKQSTQFTANQSKKVAKSDMVVGKCYQFKSGEHVVYLGKHVCAENFFCKPSYYDKEFKSQHVFYDSGNDKYIYQKGFTKLANVGDMCENYHEYLEVFVNSWRCNKVVDFWFDEFVNTEEKRNIFFKDVVGNIHYGYKGYGYYGNIIQYVKQINSLEDFLYNGNFTSTVSDLTKLYQPIFILENKEEVRYYDFN